MMIWIIIRIFIKYFLFKVEITTTKNVERKIHRQLVLEDGRVVEEELPTVTVMMMTLMMLMTINMMMTMMTLRTAKLY